MKHDDEKLNSARREILTRGPEAGSRWKHRSGGVYVVRGPAVIEATLDPAVVYAPADCPSAVPWVRPLSEFLDGRFTEEPPKPEPPRITVTAGTINCDTLQM